MTQSPQPLLEFSGACGDVVRHPHKSITQLFGDRMHVTQLMFFYLGKLYLIF